MKRLGALILAVCMLLTAVPAMADGWSEMAQTPLFGSSYNKLSNIELAVMALDGTELYFGETFSFNEVVGPRTKEMGYCAAHNGRGSVVTGGGVSQLATTLYLAVRDSGYFTIDPFKTYGKKYNDWYVEDGEDAIITDYNAGTDFSFTSWYDGVVCISAWMDDEYVYCELEFDDERQGGLIASASTPLYGSDNKRSNIELASIFIDGYTLEFGDEFSFNEIVGPRVKEAGFLNAENGRGVRVCGGGVAQVASIIYLAVKELDCIALDPIRTYGERFVDGYVDDPADAIVTDYNAGTDFSFSYWGYGTLTISIYENYYTGELVCEIYED